MLDFEFVLEVESDDGFLAKTPTVFNFESITPKPSYATLGPKSDQKKL